jgi:hypothetical protein
MVTMSKLLHYLVRPICPKRMVVKDDFRHLTNSKAELGFLLEGIEGERAFLWEEGQRTPQPQSQPRGASQSIARIWQSMVIDG